MGLVQDVKTVLNLIQNTENWMEILVRTIRSGKIENTTVKLRKCPIRLHIGKSGIPIRPSHINSISNDLKYYKAKLDNECYIDIDDNKIKLIFNDQIINLPNDKYSLTLSLPRWIIFLSSDGKILKSENKPLVEIFGYKFYLPDCKNGIYEIIEMFIDEVYNRFDFKNKTVLDIGAFIGDSSIWFIHKGAKKVLAYEPNPKLYPILKKNIEINNLSNKIVPENYAVGCSKGKAKMKVPWYGAGNIYGLFESEYSEEVEVEIVSIDEILENNNIDIIKLDCEGCEYEILDYLVKSNWLDNLEGVVFECHYINNELNPERMVAKLTRNSYDCYIKGNILSVRRRGGK
ncbi:methyltransferase, FkbM family [Archaeoglobus fulgidus DSM 8774]|uniref:Methyltransferase, FkbM family n=1 Tax=Archaeoglobus fulgidus DSM 8774 TaxID=1344584 RepID=A0A075WCZ9_ARCFL|nr:FkbM family methyltransferase [Archaeoglobus fulgidus]AIG97477.1 methyltransferase, FkbM family [Archaeoglobus fulgidus DSM 8774]